MISERTLKKWRKEALQFREDIKGLNEAEPTTELCNRILQMTQELMDINLVKKEVNK